MIQDTESRITELRGAIGVEADKLRIMWLFQTDPQRKREIESKIALLHAKHFGHQNEVHLNPPPAQVSAGEYGFGNVVFNGTELYPFGIREKELPQHVIIAGRSGSGKSNAMMLMAKNFVQKKKPFMLFSFKREYRPLLEFTDSEDDILAFTCGRDVSDFRFNPLIIPKGTDKETWINLIAEAIASVYFLGEGSISLIRKGLTFVYDNHKHPKIKHLKDWLDVKKNERGREMDWSASTKRAVDAMCFGRLGDVLNSDKPIDLEKLLDKQVILEIDNFNDDDRTFILQCLFRWLYRYALENFPRNDFRYSLLVDEAHHLFLKKSSDITGKETYSDSMLRMVRECSLGMVLADQHPSLISLPALGNTFTTIGMNLKTRADVMAIGNAMLLDRDQQDLLGKLPVGQAIVKLQDRFTDPFQIKIPLVKLDTSWTDNQIKLMMADQIQSLEMDWKDETSSVSRLSDVRTTVSERVPGIPIPDKKVTVKTLEGVEHPGLGELKKAFLIGVFKQPFIGTTSRYRKLGLSTRHGSSVKDDLIQQGYLSPAQIHIQKNTMVLFELTDKAKAWLRSVGHEIADVRSGSIEHRFGVHYVSEFFKNTSFEVSLEKQTSQGKFIDLVAAKDGLVIANQIETGKSTILQNVRSALDGGYKNVCVIATNYGAFQKSKNQISGLQMKDGQKVEVCYLLPKLSEFTITKSISPLVRAA